MRAVRFERFGPPEVLGVGSVPEPHAGPGEIRIAVRTAGVSPVDVALRAGDSPSRAGLALPHVPGVDAAGVIDEIGPGVTGHAVGDEVFGAVDVARLGGASARFAVLAFWAAKPDVWSWDEAGAAATGVETATRALDLLGLTGEEDTLTGEQGTPTGGEGTALLIDGASGGVGSIAVQLAVARGARVLGTGRPDSHAFLASLGATPVAYGPGLAERVRALGIPYVDHALDVAGKGSLAELVALTGSPDSVVTLADFMGPEHGVRLSLGRYGGQPDGCHGLAFAAELAARGRFRVPVQAVFPADRAAQAHAAVAAGPHRGKTVLDLTGLTRRHPGSIVMMT
ncbi:NADP-dependent oxidoreductase [Streptomyces sp. BH-SS-21]|uniref:NADP-dependent oxidoreductase n=1 Tax=Streptomyces liliiviolaceus TaxID=2823109 RepID=A0A940Y961_9ACTN|nr:NADP-dependent oxidoreductase [Streptomyces liliiviolaceus]MBQ0854895.1 NADP-dependent oxidoreductase [Streptomyces liliiviolaceus]